MEQVNGTIKVFLTYNEKVSPSLVADVTRELEKIGAKVVKYNEAYPRINLKSKVDTLIAKSQLMMLLQSDILVAIPYDEDGVPSQRVFHQIGYASNRMPTLVIDQGIDNVILNHVVDSVLDLEEIRYLPEFFAMVGGRHYVELNPVSMVKVYLREGDSVIPSVKIDDNLIATHRYQIEILRARYHVLEISEETSEISCFMLGNVNFLRIHGGILVRDGTEVDRYLLGVASSIFHRIEDVREHYYESSRIIP